MNSKIFVITGAAGYLGSRIALKLVRQGWTGLAVVRDKGLVTSRRRLDMALQSLGAATTELARIGNISGDLLDDDLRLPNLKSGVDAFLHCAAMVKTSRNEQEVTRANLDGTKKALQLAAECRAESFIHIGTAYSCGQGSQDPRITSVTSEETRFGAFNNSYETSKAAAEAYVKESSINWTILRPTILYHNASFGCAGTGETGCDLGLVGWFNLISAVYKIAQKNSIEEVHIPGHEGANLNLLDVDDFATMVSHLVEAKSIDPRLFWQQDFIVANDYEVKVGDLIRTLEQSDISGIKLLNGSSQTHLTRPEKAYAKQGDFFSSYASQFIRFKNDKFKKAMLSVGHEVIFKIANPKECMPPDLVSSIRATPESGYLNFTNREYCPS